MSPCGLPVGNKRRAGAGFRRRMAQHRHFPLLPGTHGDSASHLGALSGGQARPDVTG